MVEARAAALAGTRRIALVTPGTRRTDGPYTIVNVPTDTRAGIARSLEMSGQLQELGAIAFVELAEGQNAPSATDPRVYVNPLGVNLLSGHNPLDGYKIRSRVIVTRMGKEEQVLVRRGDRAVFTGSEEGENARRQFNISAANR